MMYSYPFFRFPRMGGFSSYSNYYPYSHFANSKAMPNFQENMGNSLKFKNMQVKANKHSTSKLNKSDAKFESRKEDARQDEDILFEIFGLKLYYDDVLLICLIFFLYQEGVKDQYLFFALVLLLLS